VGVCRVHFARNLLALVPKSHKDMVAAVFRTIFAQPTAEAVSATWDTVRDQLTAGFPRIGPLMDDAKAELQEADHMIQWRAPKDLAHLVLDFLS
jgi:putative transposase